MPDEMHDYLRQRAFASKRSISEVVRECVQRDRTREGPGGEGATAHGPCPEYSKCPLVGKCGRTPGGPCPARASEVIKRMEPLGDPIIHEALQIAAGENEQSHFAQNTDAENSQE